ncbi:zinc transporter ZIP3 [Tribolium castaneum]|uniref:Zinc transporter ZIP3-like Protein n=1 Tax=Tribolium castaneum TaxID=7070 RepID=D6WS09_TRICA|nr:PREDICTED: zinc transporter ZIP3 [Tribolium castaneum]EFA06404.1 Zinc transporter ZIP3-like Protein [Tribolium castaneum]|eukprot:XP_969488.1 PREDICTED: zinc transporter ZIP3 [Tribolium castaneum]
MELVPTKILVAVLFGVLRFFFGILPVKIYKLLLHWEGQDDSQHFINKKRHQQVTCTLALCQSFGGGVLFATCMLHMMPEVYKSVEELKRLGNVNTDYPLSQMTISVGFFLVYFIEELSHWFVTHVPDDACERISRSATPTSNKVAPKSAFTEEKKPIPQTPFIVDEYEKKPPDEPDTYSLNAEEIENEKNQKNIDLDSELERVESAKSSVEKAVKTKQQIMRYVLVVVALSFHAMFEGLAIGLQHSIANIWYLFVAVSIHSATILFYISLELVLAKTELRRILTHVAILSVTSPAGVLLGLLITQKANMNTQAKSTAVVLLEGLSAGTILYITFFEVLNREKERRAWTIRRGVCILGGFVLMALLQCAEMYIE